MDQVGQKGNRPGRDRAAAYLATLLVLAAVSAVALGRAGGRDADFGPALAVSRADVANAERLEVRTVRDAEQTTASGELSAAEATVTTTPEPAAIPTAVEPTAAPLQIVTSQAAPARALAPTTTPVTAPTVAVAPPMTCPATWFCYPRVGLAGPIVPYLDCSGSTDVGGSIRSFNCVNDHYLMGHAYTEFGLIRQWAAGDVVFAYGTRITVRGAITQSACSAPIFPLAPLSLQTSLTAGACGQVLVVQAR